MRKFYILFLLVCLAANAPAQVLHRTLEPIADDDDGTIILKKPILIDPDGGTGGTGGTGTTGGTAEYARYQPAGDPNLDPNWDWTSSNPVTMYYSPNGSTVTQINNRFVPFWTNGNPLAADKDMYPEDGWELVWKDFGTPTNAPANPFFVLYNKYRGTTRVMIYNATNDSYTFYKGELSFRSDSPKEPIFTHMADPEKSFAYDFDAGQIETFLGTGAKYNDWIYLDFVTFGYKNNMSNDMILHLEVHGLNQSKISLDGNISLEEQLANEAASGGSKLTGKSLMDAFKKGHSFYKSADKFKSGLDKTAKDPKNAGKWWIDAVKGLAGSSLISAVPVIGGAIGFISAFIGGKDKAAPREPMKFEGELNLSGTIETQALLMRADFKTSPGGFSPDYYTSVQDIDWGVWSMEFRPRIQITRFEECREDWYDASLTCYNSHSIIEMAQPVIPYAFNSDIGLTIIKEEAAYVYTNQEGTDYMPFSTFYNYSYQSSYYHKPAGMSIKITFRIDNPVVNSDDELVIVKTIPIDIGYVYDCEGDCYGGRRGQHMSAEEIMQEEPAAYPNPAKTELNLDVPMPEAGEVSLTILDVQGRELVRKTRNLGRGISNWKLDLNSQELSQLSTGMYYIHLQSEQLDWKQELIINR